MSFLKTILERASQWEDEDCLSWENKDYGFRTLIELVDAARTQFVTEGVVTGSVVSIHSDFSPGAVSALFALIDLGTIVVPISPAVEQVQTALEVAQVEFRVSFEGSGNLMKVSRIANQVTNEKLVALRAQGHPGLVLFSSGSTGAPKAALHDFLPLIQRYERQGKPFRTISFLLFDHIGGLNTLMSIFSSGGFLVVPKSREPEHILSLIERYRVGLLPTSPTFLNLILMSGELEKYDLSSLKLITYGTEAMPEALLQRLNTLLPGVTLKQTYGLSELGILRTQSRSNDSLWVKVGGEDYETKIVDDLLWIRSKTAMIGYLNAPSPFDSEGWLNTHDKVESDGEWVKILGRDTDIINVGGLKVYPAEVESAILKLPDVEFVAVFGKSNPIMGTVVAAKIKMRKELTGKEIKAYIHSQLRGQIEDYKIPVVVIRDDSPDYSSRFKKTRG